MRLSGFGLIALCLVGCGDADSLGSGESELGKDGGVTGATGGASSSGGSGGETAASGGSTADGGSAGGPAATGGTTGSGGAGDGGTGGVDPDVCEGKVCGDTCAIRCPDSDPQCIVPAVETYCDALGECTASLPTCGYDPCGGKQCGDACSLCPPDEPTCVETDEIKVCTPRGQCGSGDVQCPSDECSTTAECPLSDAPCRQCPDGTFACPESECVSGRCVTSFGTCKDAPPVECKGVGDCATINSCRVCPNGSFSCAVADCVNGQCVTRFPSCSGGNSCVVQGKTYASGSTGVPDPYSCNTCTCDNGRLTACTEKACDEPCPSGTRADTRCASCGPAGGCIATETGCFPVCTADTATDVCGPGQGCVEGRCVTLCL